jgi:hypothetical protein
MENAKGITVFIIIYFFLYINLHDNIFNNKKLINYFVFDVKTAT